MSRLTVSAIDTRRRRPALLTTLQTVWSRLGRARRRARTLASLRKLNDHQLRDIGLERGALERYEAMMDEG